MKATAPKFAQKRITSVAADHLLCTYGPDAYEHLAQQLRINNWLLVPVLLEAPSATASAARLALSLVVDSNIFYTQLTKMIAAARFEQLVPASTGHIVLGIEHAEVPIPVGARTALLAQLHCIAGLRLRQRPQDSHLPTVEPNQLIGDVADQPSFSRDIALLTSRILRQLWQRPATPAPTFRAFRALARDATARSGRQNCALIAEQSGMLRVNPAPQLNSLEAISGLNLQFWR